MACSFRLVIGSPAEGEGRGDSFVHKVGDEPFGGVRQIVAMVHPDTGVIGDQGGPWYWKLYGSVWIDAPYYRTLRTVGWRCCVEGSTDVMI